MHRFNYQIFSVFYLIFLTEGLATTQQGQVFTRQQAVEFALAHNLTLAAAQTTVAQAKGFYGDAGSLENPVLNLEFATDRGLTDEGQYAYAIGLEQQFPITNRLSILKNIAAIEIELAEAEIRDQQRRIALEVEKLVVQNIAIDEQIRTRQEQIELNERFAQFLSSRVETGEASTIDVNQIKVALYALEQEVRQLGIARAELLASLNTLMGLPMGSALEFRSELFLPEQAPTLLEPSQRVLEQHPQIQLKQLLYAVADKRVSLARAERWADIAVEIFFEEDRSFDDPIGLKDDQLIGVGVSIPLPIHNLNHGEIKASRAYRRQLGYELDAAQLRIRNQVKLYNSRVQRLYEQASDYRNNVTRLVEQNVEDINNAYRAGQVDLTTLFRVQEQSLNIRSSQLNLLRDYELALVEWRAATATSLYNNRLNEETIDETE
ncbi:MAG: TolC family protein [Verrucomicrobiota bacterium]